MQNPSIPTVEQAEARIVRARQAISDALAETHDFGVESGGVKPSKHAADLSSLVQSLAEAEGALRVAYIFHHAESAEVAVRRCAALLVQGADDRWSGRSGDLERSRFDGLAAAARRVLHLDVYGDASA